MPARRLEAGVQLPPLRLQVPTASSRKVVAVGTVRLSVMFATSLAAGPFIGWAAGLLGSGAVLGRERRSPWLWCCLQASPRPRLPLACPAPRPLPL